MADDSGTDIKQSVLECLQYNPDLKSLQREREAVAYDLRSAWGGYLPRLDVAVAEGWQKHNSALTRSDGIEYRTKDRFEMTTTLTQLIWDGNSQVDTIRHERARLEGAESLLFEGAEVLALNALVAHLAVMRNQELVVLSEDNVAQHLKIVSALEERQALGGGSIADVTQAKGRLYMAESTLTEQRQKLRNSVALYEKLVGHLPMALIKPESVTDLENNFDVLLTSIRKNNPKLIAKQSEVDQAHQAVGIVTGSYFPTVYVEGKSDYKDQVEGDESYSHTKTLLLKAEWNIFNGGSDWANRNAAIERRIKARKDLHALYDAVTQQANENWALREASAQNIVNFTHAVKYNTDTRDMYVMQFDVGQRSLLDVLDAENELFSSSGKLITSQYNDIVAGYRLLALDGRLLSSFEIDPAVYKVVAEEDEE